MPCLALTASLCRAEDSLVIRRLSLLATRRQRTAVPAQCDPCSESLTGGRHDIDT